MCPQTKSTFKHSFAALTPLTVVVMCHNPVCLGWAGPEVKLLARLEGMAENVFIFCFATHRWALLLSVGYALVVCSKF